MSRTWSVTTNPARRKYIVVGRAKNLSRGQKLFRRVHDAALVEDLRKQRWPSSLSTLSEIPTRLKDVELYHEEESGLSEYKEQYIRCKP